MSYWLAWAHNSHFLFSYFTHFTWKLSKKYIPKEKQILHPNYFSRHIKRWIKNLKETESVYFPSSLLELLSADSCNYLLSDTRIMRNPLKEVPCEYPRQKSQISLSREEELKSHEMQLLKFSCNYRENCNLHSIKWVFQCLLSNA